MIKDIFALVGVAMFLFGVYFIYWPLCLMISGLTLTSYCVFTVWIQAKQDNTNESN